MAFPRYRVVGACAFGLVTVLTTVSARGEGRPASRVIEYRDDALTVDLVKVPLSEVLAEIARQSHAEIRGELRESREVTARFDDVPLSQALDRLLAGQNYALIYGEDGALRAIPLLGGGKNGVTTVTGSGALQADLNSVLAQSVPVAGPAADVLGSPTASLGQLASLWLQEQNPAVRAQSMRTSFRAVEAEPELRDATLEFANAHTDEQLAQLARKFAGDQAEELLDLIASQTKVSELRSKATLVLRLLQSGG